MTHDRVIGWMAERGLTCYQTQIATLETDKRDLLADGLQHAAKLVDVEIAEIKQAAYDRYIDWATD